MRKLIDLLFLDDFRLLLDLFFFLLEHKKKVVVISSIFLFYFSISYYSNKYNYENSSNQFINYIKKGDKKFLENKQFNEYEKVRLLILNQEKAKILEEFKKKDDFVFKNLHRLYLLTYENFYDFNDPLYETKNNPWHKVFLTFKTLKGESDYKKTDLAQLYFIGKGEKC